MTTGKVVTLLISPHRGQPTVRVDQIHDIPGFGIEDKRYISRPGSVDDHPQTGCQITLIEQETIKAICKEGIQISPGQTRRNIITHRIALNDLVGMDFSVGHIQLKGVRLYEPCDYLARKIKPRRKQAIFHRGSLRSDILINGIIHLYDTITTTKREQL
jgi:MOSC domain-containing protein YiiM